MIRNSDSWPNGKKVAVSINVMFEAWSEGAAPSYSVQATQVKAGVPDAAAQAWATYGGRVGVWRLLRLFDRFQVPATFYTSGRCAELYPEAVKQIVRNGHDLAAHSYAQDQFLTYVEPDEQRKLIRRAVDCLIDCTGYNVTGWGSPGVAFTPETNDFLAEAGLTWHCDVTYVDLPFRIHTAHGDIAGVPTTDFSDNRVMKANPRDFYDAHRGTFDYLEENEPMSLMTIVLHAQFGGRPLMTAVLDELLQHILRSPNVWFARHDELAAWALTSEEDEHPYSQRFPGAP